MERRTLNVKPKDRICNTIIGQRSRVTDIVQYVANRKWKWAGHIARMKDNTWRATLGRLLRDGAERVWAFPSTTMPS